MTTITKIEPIYVKAGKRVREARQAAGKSQLDVATKVGISRASLDNIELGKQRTPLHRFPQIAKALKTTMPAMLDGIL